MPGGATSHRALPTSMDSIGAFVIGPAPPGLFIAPKGAPLRFDPQSALRPGGRLTRPKCRRRVPPGGCPKGPVLRADRCRRGRGLARRGRSPRVGILFGIRQRVEGIGNLLRLHLDTHACDLSLTAAESRAVPTHHHPNANTQHRAFRRHRFGLAAAFAIGWSGLQRATHRRLERGSEVRRKTRAACARAFVSPAQKLGGPTGLGLAAGAERRLSFPCRGRIPLVTSKLTMLGTMYTHMSRYNTRTWECHKTLRHVTPRHAQ